MEVPAMRRGEKPHVAPDAGMASVWAAGAIAALLVVATLVWMLGAAIVTRHRASGAADLAALAAAGHALEGQDMACSRARLIAERMRVVLRDCRLRHWDALVVVETSGPAPLVPFGAATAEARAGPVEGGLNSE